MRPGGKGRMFRLMAVLLVAAAMGLAACGSPGPGVPVRDGLADYSWEELSGIAQEVAAASDDEAALAVAQRYHLAGADGELDGGRVKAVELADGTQAQVAIAGFRHDDAAAGGKAGLTFIFAEAVDMRAMNNNAGFDAASEADDFDAIGGWEASEARAWLNGPFAALLPADLAAAVKPVVKVASTVPEFDAGLVDDSAAAEYSADALLGQTVDALWLPAVVEVADVAEDATAAEERPAWATVLAAEGSRYQLFADAGAAARVRTLAEQDAEPCNWWLRSVEDHTFAAIRADGSLDRSQESLASHPQGIVPCFCL